MADTLREALLPCPFCGAGETQFRENDRMWTGMKQSDPVSVSVLHWCEKVTGQPSRAIERVGKDEASAIEAWNRRALSTIPAEPTPTARDAARYQWLVENAIIETPRWRHDGKDPASTKHVLDRAIDADMTEEGKHGRPAR